MQMCNAMQNYKRMSDDPEFQRGLADIKLHIYMMTSKTIGKGKDNLEQASSLLASKPDDPVVQKMAKFICFDPTMQVMF